MKLVAWFNKLDRKSKITLILSSIGLIVIIVFVSIGLYQQNVLLVKHGKRILSTVVERRYGRKSIENIFVEYIVNGRKYRTSDIVTYYENRNNLKVNIGDQVYVIYYPPDPSIAKVDLEESGIVKTAQQIEAEKYLNIGIKKYADGEYQEAIEAFNKSIEVLSSFSEAYNGRGIAKFILEDYKGAIEDYTIAIELNPDYAKAYYNRSLVERKIKQYQRASEDCDKAIKLKKDYAEAYYSKGLILLELDKKEEACINWKKARGLGLSEVDSLIYKFCN